MWHDAKEDPPKDGVPVLVTYLGFHDGKPRNDEVAYIDNGTWYFKTDDLKGEVEITHWSELPKLPESYKNKN